MSKKTYPIFMVYSRTRPRRIVIENIHEQIRSLKQPKLELFTQEESLKKDSMIKVRVLDDLLIFSNPWFQMVTNNTLRTFVGK